MTGGIAFVYDQSKNLSKNINSGSVEIIELSSTDKATLNFFLKYIKDYVSETGSIKGKNIINNISDELKYIKMVKPINSSMEDIKKNTINKVA